MWLTTWQLLALILHFPSPVGSFATIMLAPSPYESDLFDSADALRDACVDFAKSEGYVINQRDLDKKEVDCD